MAIAQTVESYIAQRGVPYDVISHAHSHNSAETAQFAHVPGEVAVSVNNVGSPSFTVHVTTPSPA